MILIRVFNTRKQANAARKALEDGGINATVSEDKLYGVPIQKFGVRARFRLLVEDKDFPKTTKFLSEKLKKRNS